MTIEIDCAIKSDIFLYLVLWKSLAKNKSLDSA